MISHSSEIVLTQASFKKIKTNLIGTKSLKRAWASLGRGLGKLGPKSKFASGVISLGRV